MYGLGGYFLVGERNTITYGYSYTDSKADHNNSDLTANDDNAISHGITLGHDFSLNNLISTSIGLGFSDSEVVADAGNDAETYDFSLGVNFAFPWALVSLSSSHSFNDYKREDTSIDSNTIRSDYSNTSSISLTKAIGDLFPTLDPNRSLFFNISFEEVVSQSNILNYDYDTDSLTIGLSKSKSFN